MKILKIVCFSLILTIILFVSLVATQSSFFKPLIKWILERKGLKDLQGEEKGVATLDISFGFILPIIFFISLIIVIFLMEKFKKNK